MKVLVNISPHSKPYVPQYYSLFFDKVFHLCRDPSLSHAPDGNQIIWREDCQFNLSLYPEISHYDQLFCEVPVQSGLDHFISLIKPGHAHIIARACDMHHLDRPILGVINQIQHLQPRLILVSSCPTHSEFLSFLGIPTLFCPTSAYSASLSPPAISDLFFELDGSSLSSYHVRRSKIFSRLLISPFSAYIKARNYMDYHVWKKSFSGSSIYIQHNLSNNFHPPLLTASQCGGSVLINSESIRPIKPFLSLRDFSLLESYSYSSYDELLYIISRLKDDQQFFNDIRKLPNIYSAMSDNLISNFVHLLTSLCQTQAISTTSLNRDQYNSINFFEEAQVILSSVFNQRVDSTDHSVFNDIINTLLKKYSSNGGTVLLSDAIVRLRSLYGIL